MASHINKIKIKYKLALHKKNTYLAFYVNKSLKK